MGNNRAGKIYMQALDMAKHVISSNKRKNNASGVILPSGEHHYVLHGQILSAREFDEIFPLIPLRQNVNQFGNKLDGRQIEKH